MEYGTFADYAVFQESDLCIIPDGISFRVAAAYPTSLLVAYQALQAATKCMTAAQVQQANILVNGASGGIGSMVVLLSRHYYDFNHIFATTSTNNARYVEELGADTVIDYTNTRFDQVIPAKALHIVIGNLHTWFLSHLQIALVDMILHSLHATCCNTTWVILLVWPHPRRFINRQTRGNGCLHACTLCAATYSITLVWCHWCNSFYHGKYPNEPCLHAPAMANNCNNCFSFCSNAIY